MNLRQRVNAELKQAMRDKITTRVATLRLINAAIKDQDIAARAGDGDNTDGVSDTEILTILAKMTRQRNESAIAYEEAGRLDLAERERAEIEVITEFLPRQLNENEVDQAISCTIGKLSASSIRDMGRVINALKEKYNGQMDFSVVGPKVKERLSS